MAWISSSAVFSMGDGWAVYAGAHEDHVAHPCRNPADRGSRGLGPRGSGRPSALSRQAIVIGPSGADRPALASSFRPLRRPCRALRPSRTASWRASKNSSGSRYVSWMHALKGRSSSRLRTRRPEPSPVGPGRSAPQGPGLGADAGSTSLLRARDFPWVFRPVHQPVGSSLGQVSGPGSTRPGQARSAVGPTTREDILRRSPNQSDGMSREMSCATARRVREGRSVLWPWPCDRRDRRRSSPP